jgi:hypothetical protein
VRGGFRVVLSGNLLVATTPASIPESAAAEEQEHNENNDEQGKGIHCLLLTAAAL